MQIEKMKPGTIASLIVLCGFVAQCTGVWLCLGIEYALMIGGSEALIFGVSSVVSLAKGARNA